MRAGDPRMFAMKSALRAAIVQPLAFALSLVVVGNKQMALFAAFGSMALLVFVDFGGPVRVRLRAYLLLVAFGVPMIVVGTLCSQTTWLAAAAMALVGFCILFSGVLNDYVAAAYAAAMLTFVLPVMVPAAAGEIPWRLAGWGLAGVLSVSATLLLWPARPRSAVRRDAARAARNLAELVDRRSQRDLVRGDAVTRSTLASISAVRERFVSIAQRPSGTTGPTAALARLVEDLGWLYRIADRVPALAAASTPCPAECLAIEAAAPATLRSVAALLEGTPSDPELDLARLRHAYDRFTRAQLAHFAGMRPDRDEAEVTVELDEAYRLRQLAFGAIQAAQDALRACRRGPRTPPPGAAGPGASRRVLRAHASLGSVWMRNSLRGAAGLALAVLVGKLTAAQDAFWIVLGTLSVLRSSALATSTTVASALLGTLAGIIIGGLILVAVGTDEAVLWAILPVVVLVAAYAPQAISFAAGQAAFTLVVLVVFNLIEPAGWKVGIVRLEDVAAGGAISLIAGVLLWPRGTTAVLRRAVGAAYASAARSLDATISALLGDGAPELAVVATGEAFTSAQLLDTAVRDYLANRGVPPGRLHDLTLLSAGAARVRRVARLLGDSRELWRLAPLGEVAPRLQIARELFDAERHARCDWYRELGRSVSDTEPPPEPQGSGSRPDGVDLDRSVVLSPTGAGMMQPGLAIAWGQRHLDVLAEFEPTLVAACRQLNERSPTAAGTGSL